MSEIKNNLIFFQKNDFCIKKKTVSLQVYEIWYSMERETSYSKSLGELLSEEFSSCVRLFFFLCFSLVFCLRKILLLLQLSLYSEFVWSNLIAPYRAARRTHSAYIWKVLHPLERATPAIIITLP